MISLSLHRAWGGWAKSGSLSTTNPLWCLSSAQCQIRFLYVAMLDEIATNVLKQETSYQLRVCERCTKLISKKNWSKHNQRCKGKSSLRKSSKVTSREHYQRNKDAILLRRKEQKAAKLFEGFQREYCILMFRHETLLLTNNAKQN